MTKPTNPNITIPESFATDGRKADFSDEKILNGFDPINPDVLCGDNLNKFIDDTYKGLNYSMDCINDLYRGAVLYDTNETYNLNSLVFYVDSNNKTHLYRSLSNNNNSNSLTNNNYWQEIIIDASNFVSKTGDAMSGSLSFSKTGGGVISLNAIPEGGYSDMQYVMTGGLRAGFVRASNVSATERNLQISVCNNSGSPTSNFILRCNNDVASCTFPNTTCCDGQWVRHWTVLSTSTAQGNYQIDLSSHLPSDYTNYDYEVMVHFAGSRTNGSTNSFVTISDSALSPSTEADLNGNMYGSANFDGDHGETGAISCIVIARKNDAKFWLNITRANLTTGSLSMIKYRRIGTNA